MRTLAVLVGAWAAALAPQVALACSVCFSASDETRAAFLGTTLFLTLLPVALVVAGVLWLRKLGVGAAYDPPDRDEAPEHAPPLPVAHKR